MDIQMKIGTIKNKWDYLPFPHFRADQVPKDVFLKLCMGVESLGCLCGKGKNCSPQEDSVLICLCIHPHTKLQLIISSLCKADSPSHH